MNVALINVPFITIRHSSPALSLFKTLLKRVNVSSKVFYLNIDFYNEISNRSIHDFLVKNSYHGDWLASRLAFGDLNHDEQYFGKCGLSPKSRILMLNIRNYYENFCHKITSDTEWNQYDAFAFSTNIGQTVSAIAIAKLLKQKFPSKKIYLGGYGVFKEIGVELLEKTPWIDAVFWHNSDKTFVNAMQRSKNTENIEDIMSGLGSTSYRNKQGEIVSDLTPNRIDHNDIDIPDFHDFLDKEFNTCYSDNYGSKWCNIEFSRGCYYGESVVCTFCSEPGLKMKTKPKSYEKAIEYLQMLENEYPGNQCFTIGDSLLPQGYIENVFQPWTKLKRYDSKYFTELKPYATPKQLKILSEAGVKIVQPGIESFHPEILKLTKKGHKVHHGISFLNFCQHFGIDARWNYLVLVPKEKPEWYNEQIEIIKNMMHFQPPFTVGRIIVTKHTPYSDNPQGYDIKELIPDSFYQLIYPEYFDLQKLCWNYDNTYAMTQEISNAVDLIQLWRHSKNKELKFVDKNTVLDTRTGNKKYSLSDKQCEIIRFCLYPKAKTAVERVLGDVENDVNQLVNLKLLYSNENRYVSYISVPDDYDIDEFEEDKNLIQLLVNSK